MLSAIFNSPLFVLFVGGVFSFLAFSITNGVLLWKNQTLIKQALDTLATQLSGEIKTIETLLRGDIKAIDTLLHSEINAIESLIAQRRELDIEASKNGFKRVDVQIEKLQMDINKNSNTIEKIQEFKDEFLKQHCKR